MRLYRPSLDPDLPTSSKYAMTLITLAWHRTPLVQVIIVGMLQSSSYSQSSPTLVGVVFFATVGMFLAASNLGAGGTQDIALSDISNSVLYGCFALMGLIAGGVTNREYFADALSQTLTVRSVLGPRFTMFLGTLGYVLYIGSLWCFQTQGTRWFVIFAGAMLGISAALLWSAQGVIMMSYPLEKDKGWLSVGLHVAGEHTHTGC